VTDPQKKTYRCPTCRKTVELPVDCPHRPFCSPVCKLVDLGRGLDEEYRIARPIGPDDPEFPEPNRDDN